MSERRKEIYVSGDVLHSLILIAKSENGDAPMGAGLVSADSIADRIIRDHIKENYPQLLEHQRKVDKMEKELIEALNK